MKKLSLKEMKSLTRNEMKKIMAGSGSGCDADCNCGACTMNDGSAGSCRKSQGGTCYCATGNC